ncbi:MULTISPECIES: transposase [Micromonospora]|nr:hypothetical protein C1A38_04950 [Verrucosispora sp. ts21]
MRTIFAPLMPVRDLRKGSQLRKYGDRLILDSVFCVLQSGCPWRMMPRDLAPPDAAHRWFTTWRKSGTGDAIDDEFRRRVRVAAGREHYLLTGSDPNLRRPRSST